MMCLMLFTYMDSNLKNGITNQIQEQRRKLEIFWPKVPHYIVLGYKWNKAVKKIEPTTRTVVVSNTVHILDYTTSWNGDSFQILFLGVLIKRKDVADLIQAISLLKKEGRLNNIKFIIAGSESEEENLKQQASELQVELWIEFVGWTDGKAKELYLKESQTLVLPSYNEVLPISVLEAISYVLPVIDMAVGEMAAIVRGWENGFLIKPGDVSALTDKIKKITEDKNQYTQMSMRSK